MMKTISRIRMGVLWGVVLMAGLILAPTVQADRVVLMDEAYVKGPKVTIGDVAQLEGEFAKTLAHIELSSAAIPGSSKSINASLVLARVRSTGLDMDGIEFGGASHTRATTLSEEIGKNHLATSLREFIVARMPWDALSTEVDVPLPNQIITVPEGDLDIQWYASPQYQFLGPGTFSGKILVDGEEKRTLTMRAHVTAYGEVLVARGDIARGRPISANDIEVQQHALNNMPTGVLTEAVDVIGLVAKKTIFPGQAITTRNTQQRLVVSRNQLIPIEVRVGNLIVKDRAKAMMDGRTGDTIMVQNQNSKAQFQGIVRKDGVLVVQ